MSLIKSRCFCFIVILLLELPLFAQVTFNSSDIPIVIIETNGLEIVDEPRIVADMFIIDHGANMRNSVTDSINGYKGKISIEIRGYSSQTFSKKQYGFETQNNDGSNNNVSLLGLPSENDWILSAPYSDKSLIRNMLAYNISERMGHYAPRTRLCELILNDEYMGVYVLTEKIKRDKKRVDISKLKSNEISGDCLTGGYIIKIDRLEGDGGGWNTPIANKYLQYEYPDKDVIAPEQKMYISNYVNDFEEVLFSDNLNDSVSGYRSFIDFNSCLDYFLVNEIAKNIDAYRLSTYMYKDKDSKGGRLTFGPVWDYNVAFGNADYLSAYKTTDLIAKNDLWWSRLLQDTAFCDALESRWIELRTNQLSNINVLNIIDSLSAIVSESQKRNFQRWNVIGNGVWPNYYIGYSYKDEIDFLKSWVINRFSWLDMELVRDGYVNYPDVEISFFPNPFNYFFTYVFSLKEDCNVTLSLFD
ncbi:MAG: CotH kinase family protein, partial [Bacteroidota bacterium]|nr:CotH kinase family protein [Bacteroidota bacterium]